MRNLTVHRRGSRLLESLRDTILSNLEEARILHAVNSINDDFYLFLENKLHKIPADYEKGTTTFDVNECFKLVDLEYCSITQELYAACDTGDLIRLNVDDEFECEVVAKLNAEVQCMKLSPDHEILVFVTSNGNVITMVSTFQVISQANLYSSEFGQKQFVTVGWGKKETQFHGSEGKKAALAKPDQVNQNEQDNGTPKITWREDGSLFAVGFLNPENRARQFKVFNREGVLQYTSELLNGIEECLSWKPSGSLIATTQTLANKHVVAFFEKNGLKHREFTLPFKPKEIIINDLFWSPDSEILTIWCKVPGDSTSMLQLWTENNYHWYLKQTITFSADNPLIYATWSTESRTKKLILLMAEELLTCTYNWTVNHSRGRTMNDNAVVGVIDGNKSLMTGFKVGIIPPPMSHLSLESRKSVNAIVFAPDNTEDNWSIDSNTFFCVSCDNSLTFYVHSTNEVLEYQSVGPCEIQWNTPKTGCESALYTLHHFLWLKANRILCSASSTNQSFLCVLTVDILKKEKPVHVPVQQTYLMDGLIEHIIPSPEPGEAYIVVENSVLKFTNEMDLIPMDIQLPDHTYQVEVVQIGTKHIILSLSHRNTFSIDGNQIANNITSFYVHSEFLLLTTLQHTLVCITLNARGFDELNKQDLTVKPWENKSEEKTFADLNIRRVERGSILVIAISKDSKTILQLPRGNLECIQPRALSLYIIGYHLNVCDYLSAFDLMRRQRINLNLIYDHDPRKFIENAQRFVDDIKNSSWLSLFLSELQDVDVTKTIYRNYYWKDRAVASSEANKVEHISELLRLIMEKRNESGHLIQPILISLVKSQQKQGFETALMKVKEIKELEESGKAAGYITPEEALKYLLYLVDVNLLFDTALGMYDLELTMFIASKSQKDPKEYVPFLNELKKHDENYMKYSIDLYLKRYDSALTHIAKEPNKFTQCLDLVRDHDLYTQALKLFQKKSVQYKEIAAAYGEFLLKRKKYLEAGIMFSKGDDHEQALHAYSLAGSWQDVIITAAHMKLSPAEKQKVYKELVDRLKAFRKYSNAATVLAQYLNNVEDAVATLCEDKLWKRASRLVHDADRLDLIDTYIKPKVFEYAESIITQTEKNKEEFERLKRRLATVRSNISKRIAQTYNEFLSESEHIRNTGISDILSDTSSCSGSTLSNKSGSSTGSGRTYRSSKNRRKLERKFFSLKEGSICEDLALIQALYHIVFNTYKEKGRISPLVQMLVEFDHEELAEKVQNSFEDFLQLIDRSKRIILDESAPSSLAEMQTLDMSFAGEMQDILSSQKVLERLLALPKAPETISEPWKLELF